MLLIPSAPDHVSHLATSGYAGDENSHTDIDRIGASLGSLDAYCDRAPIEREISKEVQLALQGYTVSVHKKVVLGKFRDTYVMRTAEHKLTAAAGQTSPERLAGLWSRFRQLALGEEYTAPVDQLELSDTRQIGNQSRIEPGVPSPEAMRVASDAASNGYFLPESKEHPAVRASLTQLAHSLMAYGLAGEQPGMPVVASTAGHHDQRARRHILLVDDVTDVLVSVGAFLTKEGYVVRKAASGDEALRVIRDDPQIDLLVTDFAMPGLNGAELIALAAEERPHLKALVITGYPNADGLAELPAQTGILVKPFRRDALVAALNSLLWSAANETVGLDV